MSVSVPQKSPKEFQLLVFQLVRWDKDFVDLFTELFGLRIASDAFTRPESNVFLGTIVPL
jgi:hypothetical protein